jgi:hypothetical protein
MDAAGAVQFAWAEEEENVAFRWGTFSTGNAWRLTSKTLSNYQIKFGGATSVNGPAGEELVNTR